MIGSDILRQRRALVYGVEALVLGVIAWLVVAGVVANRAPAGPPVIAVSDVWARATPPGATTGAVYLTIANTGGTADTLVRASTSVAGSVVIHRTSVAEDRATMEAMPGGLAAGHDSETVLAPGGAHLMLVDLVAPLVEGTIVPVTLDFVAAGRIVVEAIVLGVGAMGPPGTP
jgi:copper(I)-binding protein